MRRLTPVLGTVAAALAFVLCFLAFSSGSAADDQDVAKKVQELADAIAKKDDKAIKKQAEALRKEAEIDEIMQVFRLRQRKGLGVGPVPNAITPDGIEAKIMALGKHPLKPVDLAAQSRALERAGHVAAAVAEVVKEPPAWKGQPNAQLQQQWRTYVENMHRSALDLADAARNQDPAALKIAATKLKNSCNSCHELFRGGPPVAPPLLAIERVRRMLLDKDPIPALREALKADDAELRKEAALGLGTLGEKAKGIVPQLVESLRDKDPKVRDAGYVALTELGPAARLAIPTLIQTLKDDIPSSRGQARRALVKIGPAAVPSLKEALQEADPGVRQSAAYTLGRIGPPAKEAIPPLLEARRGEDKLLRMLAEQAIKNIDPEAARKAGIP